MVSRFLPVTNCTQESFEFRIATLQRVYALALGYEDLNDHETLRLDLAIQTALGTHRGTGQQFGVSSQAFKKERKRW